MKKSWNEFKQGIIETCIGIKQWSQITGAALFTAGLLIGVVSIADMVHTNVEWVRSKVSHASTEVYVNETFTPPKGINTEGVDPEFLKQLTADAKKIMDDPNFLKNNGCDAESLKIAAFGQAANNTLVKSAVMHDRTPVTKTPIVKKK